MKLNERATRAAIEYVIEERRRQVLEWGDQTHPPLTWSAILTEECGESRKRRW